jgi:hypothetical protein
MTLNSFKSSFHLMKNPIAYFNADHVQFDFQKVILNIQIIILKLQNIKN